MFSTGLVFGFQPTNQHNTTLSFHTINHFLFTIMSSPPQPQPQQQQQEEERMDESPKEEELPPVSPTKKKWKKVTKAAFLGGTIFEQQEQQQEEEEDFDRFCREFGASQEEVLKLSEQELQVAVEMLLCSKLVDEANQGYSMETVLQFSEDDLTKALEKAFPATTTTTKTKIVDRTKVVEQWKKRKKAWARQASLERKAQKTPFKRESMQHVSSMPSVSERMKQLMKHTQTNDGAAATNSDTTTSGTTNTTTATSPQKFKPIKEMAGTSSLEDRLAKLKQEQAKHTQNHNNNNNNNNTLSKNKAFLEDEQSVFSALSISDRRKQLQQEQQKQKTASDPSSPNYYKKTTTSPNKLSLESYFAKLSSSSAAAATAADNSIKEKVDSEVASVKDLLVPTKTIENLEGALEEAQRRRDLSITYTTPIQTKTLDPVQKKALADFLFVFQLLFEDKSDERQEILKLYPEVAEALKGCLCSKIEFWERYFWRCDAQRILRQAQQQKCQEAMNEMDIVVLSSTEDEENDKEDTPTGGETTEPEDTADKPFDGRWIVSWKDPNGKEKSTTIQIQNNQYMQSGLCFSLNLEDPLHPCISWPGSKHKQTVEEGVDLTNEPNGPKVGDRIRWVTSSPSFAELVWTRESIDYDVVTTEATIETEPFQSVDGLRVLVPAKWKKSTGSQSYHTKWQDPEEKHESIKLASKPVTESTKSIEVLGDCQIVGECLSYQRNVQLVSAEQRSNKTGTIFYKFSFYKNNGDHQLLQLCISEGLVWSIGIEGMGRTWDKRVAMYEKVLESFQSDPQSEEEDDVVEGETAEDDSLESETEVTANEEDAEPKEIVEHPLDGKWNMEWKNTKGKAMKVELIVKDSQYFQSGVPFVLNFDDPQHPFIPWPNSDNKQTVEEGLNLLEEPRGPKVGDRILWRTTSASFPELFWTRKTIGSDSDTKQDEIKEVQHPFDGRWKVHWKNKNGEDKKVKIEVKQSSYQQSDLTFSLKFDDPIHPSIAWPQSTYVQTVQDGVNLTEEPHGPKVGDRIRWTTTSPSFPELFWVRESISDVAITVASEEKKKKKKKKEKRRESVKKRKSIKKRKSVTKEAS